MVSVGEEKIFIEVDKESVSGNINGIIDRFCFGYGVVNVVFFVGSIYVDVWEG